MTRIVRLSRFITLAPLVIALLILPGCGKKLADNFSKVKPGMSPTEVEELLGAPKQSSEVDLGATFKGVSKIPGMPDIGGTGGKMAVKYWEEGDNGYIVYFQDDKVTQTLSGTKAYLKGAVK
jgi:hypothetical protein